MQVKPFVNTEAGEMPLNQKRAIKNSEKLRLVIIPETRDSQGTVGKYIEVLNPLELQVVTGKLPEYDQTKLVFFDVIIPENWLGGIYCANVLDIRGKILCSCVWEIKQTIKLH